MAPDLQLSQFETNGYLYGDCDDSATLSAALLDSLGVRCWFVAIRNLGEEEFSHVWVRAVASDHQGVVDIDPIVRMDMLPLRGFVEKLELCI